MTTNYKGIDYGLGETNIHENGIRNGVIHSHAVCQAWCDSSEPYYIHCCPECGEELSEDSEDTCVRCNYEIKESDFDFLEPDHFYLKDDEYEAVQDSYGDIFITKSPYYTYAQFCSPCAPGACHLENPLEEKDENNKCYCFGHDWFENGVAPYTVYDVETNEVVDV